MSSVSTRPLPPGVSVEAAVVAPIPPEGGTTNQTKPLHQFEWEVLLDAIRNDTPHNETERAIYANLAAVMGRAAVHSGQMITWEQALASEFQFVANVDDLDYDSPAPVKADDEGRYPVPIPGQWTEI